MSDVTVTSGSGDDALKSVADAMEAAVNAAKETATDARSTAAEALPAVGKLLSNLVYKACYGISYGVVFPSVLIAKSIPQNNPAVHGFIDGGRAAIDMVDEMKMKGKVSVESSAPAAHSTILGPGGEPLS
jgi:hypothetical protein